MRKWIAGLFAATSLSGGAVFGADHTQNPYDDKGDHYELDIKAEIEQGERVEIAKDKAAMTLKGWNDEYAITISPQIPKTGGDFAKKANRPLLSKKMEYREGEVTAFIEPRSDTEFDIDFTLHSKPETNLFTYTIGGADQFDFFYQPELTPEEIAQGAERPENVAGSYAVYHKTKANHRIGSTNYATGKAFHIYRPKAIDANGAEVWADLSYESSALSVVVPQEWLAKAAYPVVVDPTIGYAVQGASNAFWGSAGADSMVSVGANSDGYNLPTFGVATAVSYWCKSNSGSIPTKGTIYSDSSGPNAKKGVGSANSCTTTLGLKVSTLSLQLTSGNYWPGSVSDGAQASWQYDTDASYKLLFKGSITSYEVPPDPFPASPSTDANRRFSFYITYTDCSAEPCTETFTSTGYNTWTAPAGVTEAIVACWGAGGGGGETAAAGGGGGGGGAFASSTLSVSAGTTYDLWIGAGGAEDNATWASESNFATSSCPSCVIASGGKGTADNTAGSAGPTASSTGTTKFAGGVGGAASAGTLGGGGGGSAGPHGAGNAGQTPPAGVGGTGGSGDAGSGGAGGAGGNGSSAPGGVGTSNSNGGGGGGGGDTSAGAGGNAGTPGGGGGGAAGTGTNGGDGAAGQCTVTYTVAAAAGGATPSPGDFIFFD